MSAPLDRVTQNSSDVDFLALRFWRTCALLMVSLGCAYACMAQLVGVDFWLQAKIGELIAVSHEIPRTLLFPYTEIAEQGFNAHEWLSSLAFHGLLTTFGIDGLPFVHAVLGLLLLSMVVWLGMVRSRGNWASSLFGGLLAVAVENYRHVLRPELVAILLLVGFWIVMERLKQRFAWRHVVLVLLLQVVWVNAHGSFILGPMLVGVYAAGNHLDGLMAARSFWVRPNRASVTFGGLALTCLAACLVNPFGVEMLRFVVGFSTDPELRNVIGEWMPTFMVRWIDQPGWWIAMIVWTASVAWIGLFRRNVQATDVLVFLMFSVLAAKAIRFPVYLGIVAAYLVSGLQPAIWTLQPLQIRVFKGTAVLALVLTSLVVAFGNARGAKPYSYGVYRLGPDLEAALANPQYKGNVFNSMELGAELIYRSYPRLRPAIDCRVDSYGMDYFKYMSALLGSPKLLQEFLDRYHVRYMLYEKSRLADAIKNSTFDDRLWSVLAQDKYFIFLEYLPHASTTDRPGASNLKPRAAAPIP